MLRKRNNIEISVKGLILAVVVIIALVLSAIALYMVTRSRATINDGNTQYSQLMSDYSEINATLYDGLYVSGEKVIDVIDEVAATLSEGVTVITKMNPEGTTYILDEEEAEDNYSLYNNEDRADKDYINTSGTFVGKVRKNANGMVVNICFSQTD